MAAGGQNARRISQPTRRWSSIALVVVIPMIAGTMLGSGLSRTASVMMLVGLAAAEVLAIRGARLGAQSQDGVLVVRNLLTTRRVPWKDIADFEVRGRGNERGLAAVLADGRIVPLRGIEPTYWSPPSDDDLAATIDLLRSWQREAQS